MRSFRLARFAAEAEALRLRALAARTARRGLLALVALIFLIAALVAVHVAAAIALLGQASPLATVLILGAADLIIAIGFALCAARDVPSIAERDALQLRRTAVAGIRQEASVASLVAAVFAMVSRKS